METREGQGCRCGGEGSFFEMGMSRACGQVLGPQMDQKSGGVAT
jgi:hypothetical protein